jgi:hypothetical protein
MKELIYCNDLEAFKIALTANGFYDEESDSFVVNHSITPIKKKEIDGKVHSLSYVMNCVLPIGEVTDEDGNTSVPYPTLESLGDYEEMFADEDKHNKYKLVHPYDQPIVYTDEDGNEQSYMLPKKIGVFA